MVSQDSGNKKLFTFIKNKNCENSGIAPLKENGNLYGDPKTKAKLLNSQFSSVFSTETHQTSQTLEPANIMKHDRLLSPKMVYTNCYMA